VAVVVMVMKKYEHELAYKKKDGGVSSIFLFFYIF
jgi:hypothetical protein